MIETDISHVPNLTPLTQKKAGFQAQNFRAVEEFPFVYGTLQIRKIRNDFTNWFCIGLCRVGLPPYQ